VGAVIWLGYVLMSVPIVATIAGVVYAGGWRLAALTVLTVSAMLGCMVVGAALTGSL
tara:strand:- start:2679 stop:2849 length:171 start_codon:yes stop_codon:yes gene_type:complete